MFCKNCGNKLTEGEKFCTKCGSGVNSENNTNTQNVQNVQNNTNNIQNTQNVQSIQNNTNSTQNGKKKKSLFWKRLLKLYLYTFLMFIAIFVLQIVLTIIGIGSIKFLTTIQFIVPIFVGVFGIPIVLIYNDVVEK
jgi:uncharacterized membrane protein YvbJ